MPVLKLNSLQSLFFALEERQIEIFTRRLVIIMRDGSFTLSQQRRVWEILKKVSSLTKTSSFVYALASSLVAMESQDIAEKRQITLELINMTQVPEIDSELLELIAGSTVNLLFEDELSLEEKKELLNQLHRMTLFRNATPETINIYARGLFNISVDEPTVEGKRGYTSRLRTLALYGKGTVTTMIHAGKALVNLACFTQIEGERIRCISTLEPLLRKPRANTELKHIYVSGLVNFITDETNQETFRNRYFRKLKKIAQAPDATWVIRKMYAQALLCMALYTENIQEKRRYVREIIKLVEMPECVTDIFVTAARAIFNHQIDENSLKRKKVCIKWLENLLERSGNAQPILWEYARSLVNIAIDDPIYENKRHYSTLLLKLTELRSPSLDIVLEYAKSLLNLALSEESSEQKIQDLTTLLNIDRDIHYRRTNLAEKTPVNYLCVRAEALALMLRLEHDPLERRKILSRIPPLTEIKESEYFPVFMEIYNDSLKEEKDWSIKNRMIDLLDNIRQMLHDNTIREDR